MSRTIGTITVGQSKGINGKSYLLSLNSDATLTLSIGEIPPPQVLSVSADITVPTNRNVTVTATFSEDSVMQEYSLDESEWNAYSDGVVMTLNGTVYFRATNEWGTSSEIASYTVSNINKDIPDAPVVVVDIDWPTHKAVTVTAEFASECVIRQFTMDGEIWLDYSEPITVLANTTLLFRGQDSYGNFTETTECEVSNIVAPQTFDGHLGVGELENSFALTTEAAGFFALSGDFGSLNASVSIMNGKKKVASGTVKKGVLTFNSKKNVLLEGGVDYSILVKSTDKGKTDAEFAMTLSPVTIFGPINNEDDVWTAQGLSAFNLENGWTDWAGYGDVMDYQVLNLATAARVSFDLSSSDATKFTIWSVNEKTGKLKSIQSTTPKANKAKTEYTATTKNLLLAAGSYYISVEAKNAKKGSSADYMVALNDQTVFFTKGNNTDDTCNGSGVSVFEGEWTDWTGYGDAMDFRALRLDTAACLNFDVVSSDAAKFTIWQLDDKTHKLKSKQSTTLKANKAKTEYTASTKELLVTAGTYYLSVECTSAKKGGSADYTVSEGGAFTRFPVGDNTNDIWKAVADSEALDVGATLTGWVGFGDATDFYKLQIEEAGQLCLTFDEATEVALAGKEIKLSCLDGKRKSVSLASFNGESVNSKKTLAAGEYYIGVTCANVKKYNATYNVSVGMLAG